MMWKTVQVACSLVAGFLAVIQVVGPVSGAAATVTACGGAGLPRDLEPVEGSGAELIDEAGGALGEPVGFVVGNHARTPVESREQSP